MSVEQNGYESVKERKRKLERRLHGVSKICPDEKLC